MTIFRASLLDLYWIVPFINRWIPKELQKFSLLYMRSLLLDKKSYVFYDTSMKIVVILNQPYNSNLNCNNRFLHIYVDESRRGKELLRFIKELKRAWSTKVPFKYVFVDIEDDQKNVKWLLRNTGFEKKGNVWRLTLDK